MLPVSWGARHGHRREASLPLWWFHGKPAESNDFLTGRDRQTRASPASLLWQWKGSCWHRWRFRSAPWALRTSVCVQAGAGLSETFSMCPVPTYCSATRAARRDGPAFSPKPTHYAAREGNEASPDLISERHLAPGLSLRVQADRQGPATPRGDGSLPDRQPQCGQLQCWLWRVRVRANERTWQFQIFHGSSTPRHRGSANTAFVCGHRNKDQYASEAM
jgi:hypothetical protein